MATCQSETKAILTNKDVIAVNQDPLGVQAFKYAVNDSLETWLKPLEGGDWAIAFLNRNQAARQITFNWQATPVYDSLSNASLNAKAAQYKLSNLWTKEQPGTTAKPLTATVPPHDVLMLRLIKQ